MADRLIVATLEDGIARLVLNDPERLNALSPAMIDEALPALDEMLPKARVLVVSGAGRAFCSGANLTDGTVGQQAAGGGGVLATHFNPFILRIKDSPVPVVMAVRGAAAGFGASLALAGDLIVASEKSYFLQAFCNIGLVPDGGSAATLVKAIGRVRAVELMLMGKKLPAAKALEWGLITQVVPDEELDEVVDGLTRQVARGPTVALGKIRQMAWAAGQTSFEDELELEIDNQTLCARTADYKEGVAAFREKRPALFQGR